MDNENEIVHNGELYKAEEVDTLISCKRCAFYQEVDGFCNDVPCSPSERTDNKMVIFVKVQQ